MRLSDKWHFACSSCDDCNTGNCHQSLETWSSDDTTWAYIIADVSITLQLKKKQTNSGVAGASRTTDGFPVLSLDVKFTNDKHDLHFSFFRVAQRRPVLSRLAHGENVFTWAKFFWSSLFLTFNMSCKPSLAQRDDTYKSGASHQRRQKQFRTTRPVSVRKTNCALSVMNWMSTCALNRRGWLVLLHNIALCEKSGDTHVSLVNKCVQRVKNDSVELSPQNSKLQMLGATLKLRSARWTWTRMTQHPITRVLQERLPAVSGNISHCVQLYRNGNKWRLRGFDHHGQIRRGSCHCPSRHRSRKVWTFFVPFSCPCLCLCLEKTTASESRMQIDLHRGRSKHGQFLFTRSPVPWTMPCRFSSSSPSHQTPSQSISTASHDPLRTDWQRSLRTQLTTQVWCGCSGFGLPLESQRHLSTPESAPQQSALLFRPLHSKLTIPQVSAGMRRRPTSANKSCRAGSWSLRSTKSCPSSPISGRHGIGEKKKNHSLQMSTSHRKAQ